VTAVFQATVYGQWCAPIYIYPRPSAPVAVKPLINVTNNNFDPPSVAGSGGANHTSTGSIMISASPAATGGLQQGDFVVVEIIKNTAGGTFTYIPETQTQNVTLNLGDTTPASFQVTANGAPTQKFSFTIRVSDVRHPNGSGGSDSILTQVLLNPASGGAPKDLQVTN
jgi:hypothetical protein